MCNANSIKSSVLLVVLLQVHSNTAGISVQGSGTAVYQQQHVKQNYVPELELEVEAKGKSTIGQLVLPIS